jgi:hypothetical protein
LNQIIQASTEIAALDKALASSLLVRLFVYEK